MEEDDAKLLRLRRFQQKHDSLRLAASSIAAMSGFHPFACLPKLLMELVYQGSIGRELHRHDCELLDLEIATDEEILMELASRAGASTRKALQSALNVKKGTKKVHTSEGANEIKEKVLREATQSQKLSIDELRILTEGVRHSVNTGFGVSHEEDALDMYAKQCGWEIKERNEHVLSWPFTKADTVDQTATSTPTVIPLSEAIPYVRQADADKSKVKAIGVDFEQEETVVNLEGVRSVYREVKRLRTEAPRKSSEAESSNAQDAQGEIVCDGSAQSSSVAPFFMILGSVDGILEELWYESPRPGEQHSPHWDGWRMRRVVVECKHRINSAKVPPPLYDQIQATAYCLMQGVQFSDIVQVMRKAAEPSTLTNRNREGAETITDTGTNDVVSEKSPLSGRHEKSEALTLAAASRTSVESPGLESSSDTVPISTEGTENVQKGEGKEVEKGRERERKAEISIVVTRVALDDPVMQHRQNWTNVILPRLRSFVEAVYRIRENDDKRYKLLSAMSEAATVDAGHDAWDILHEECPWLVDCDTAYHRLQNMPERKGVT